MPEEFDNKHGFLLGEHLSHSFSPQIHSMLGDYSYNILEVEKENLDGFMKTGSFDFLNVTIPYKKSVIPYLDFLSEDALEIGAVNTVKRLSDGKLCGYNTDFYGFDYLLGKSKISVNKKKVLVLGSGGASLPVKAVLKNRGASQIITISRSGENNYENISRHYDADVIVNTTPVGMFPDNLSSPITLDFFTKCSGVIDIIYNPARTKLLLDAQRLNIPNIGGLYMLVAQAKRAAEIFTDSEICDSKIDMIYNTIRAQTENIILIGMPGCGKSSIGKILAQTLCRKFIDADIAFFEKYGASPATVIENKGEELFRHMESSLIFELGKLSGCVISCGGGVVTRDENYPALHQNGVLFYVERDLDKLSEENRPLSKAIGIKRLYEQRHNLYMYFADYRISNNSKLEAAADKISKIIKESH